MSMPAIRACGYDERTYVTQAAVQGDVLDVGGGSGREAGSSIRWTRLPRMLTSRS